LLIYYGYCHDLNHVDPVIIKQSESSNSKTIETNNNDAIEGRFQTTQDLNKPLVYESNQPVNDQQIHHTIPAVDISSQNQAQVLSSNDATTPFTPVQTFTQQHSIETPSSSPTIQNIPVSNDNSNINNAQTIDSIQQQKFKEDPLSIQKRSQQEQIQPISDHIPIPSTTQQQQERVQPISDHIPVSSTTPPYEQVQRVSDHIPVPSTAQQQERVQPISDHIPVSSTTPPNEQVQRASDHIPVSSAIPRNEQAQPVYDHIPVSSTTQQQEQVQRASDYIPVSSTTPPNEQVQPISNHIPVSSTKQEQVQPIPDHIPVSSTTQEPVSNIIQNSNLPDVKSDHVSQVPLNSVHDTATVPNESHIPVTTPSPGLRSTLSHIHGHRRQVQIQSDDLIKKDASHSNDEHSQPSKLAEEQQHVETSQKSETNPNIENNNIKQTNEQILKANNDIDLPRQVRVHPPAPILNQQDTLNVLSTKEDSNLILDKEIENITTATPILMNDITTHLPRIHENDEKELINNSQTYQYLNETELKPLTNKSRQICWQLPKKFDPSIELLENEIFRFINILPEFVQTIFFEPIDDREVLMNTMWLSSVGTMFVLISFFFLSMGTKRLKQSKSEKEVRARCQQLQQYNNQIDLERATFERQNQKLSDEIDDLKNIPVRDTDEDIFALREECSRFHEDLKLVRIERDTLQQNIDYKQSLIQKHEYDMQRQVEIVASLNNDIAQLKQELEKERVTVGRLQSTDLSLERFEKTQEVIQELKSEITQLKQEKFAQKDQLHEIQDHANQLDIENNQLTIRMKQLKVLLEQREQTIKNIQEKITDEEPQEFEELLSIIKENSSNNNQQLLSTIDNDCEKSNQHIRDLHKEVDEKTAQIKEFDVLLKQERDRCREIETKLKVVLELRERDAHLHIRQLGQTDAELRKARTDTERVRILQQQLELKQQQLDDVQKVLSTEQLKFNDECSKLQHETHERWVELKRLTRELELSKQECEGLRKQITKYANSERSSQEKSMIKPVPQHYGNNETNGNSPNSYQQGDKPIDHQRNDSGTLSPVDMFMSRPPPPFMGFPRPPFFPPSFMSGPPPNAFIMHPRFPMPTTSPHGMISPLSHLMINSNDTNNSEITDSSNVTPNSTSYETHSNGGILSPVPENEKKVKTKKTKKSTKKKTETSIGKEDV
ncbi:unnamed protein product, partial [Adineta steineri]